MRDNKTRRELLTEIQKKSSTQSERSHNPHPKGSAEHNAWEAGRTTKTPING